MVKMMFRSVQSVAFIYEVNIAASISLRTFVKHFLIAEYFGPCFQ